MNTPARRRRKEQVTVRRQAEILDAGWEIFTQKGYDAATIPEIAKRAGVAVGTIYNYYPNKRELFIAVVKSVILSPMFLDLIEKLSEQNLDEIFQSIMENRLELIAGDKVSRMPLLISEILRDPELRELFSGQLIHTFLSNMEEFYKRKIAAGTIRNYQPEIIVRVVGGMFMGFALLKGIEGDNSPLNRLPRDKVIQDMMQFILYGLLK